MSVRIVKLFLLPGLIWAFIACDQEGVTPDPGNNILGKWTLIQSGETRIETTEYMEFLPDSILSYFSMNEGPFFLGNKYAINDSTLYIGQFSQKGFSGNAYYYEFFDKGRKLKLSPNYGETTWINITAIPVTVYKQVK